MRIKYICSNSMCGTVKETDNQKPKEWVVRRNKDLFQQCPNCGRFMVPEELVKPGEPLDRQIFFMFAGCINAYECELFDQYGPSCEQGKVMTKCFHAIHEKQELHENALAECLDRLGRIESFLQKQFGQEASPGDGK